MMGVDCIVFDFCFFWVYFLKLIDMVIKILWWVFLIVVSGLVVIGFGWFGILLVMNFVGLGLFVVG